MAISDDLIYAEGKLTEKNARRSPVTASQGSAETSPRPQEKNRLRQLFRHLRQPAKLPRLFFSCPLRRAFLLRFYIFEKIFDLF